MRSGILTDIYRQAGQRLEVQDYGVDFFEGGYSAALIKGELIEGRMRLAEGTPLKQDSLVRVFKTISEGDELWSGTVKLEYQSEKHTAETGYSQQAVLGMWVHGLQEGLEPQKWAAMFHDNLPAILEKPDGKIIHGALEPFFETGTEGVIWSIQEYGKNGYDALNDIKSGDTLTVFSAVTNGEIDWEGRMDFDANGPASFKATDWYTATVARLPKHIEPADWQKLTWQKRPVLVMD